MPRRHPAPVARPRASLGPAVPMGRCSGMACRYAALLHLKASSPFDAYAYEGESASPPPPPPPPPPDLAQSCELTLGPVRFPGGRSHRPLLNSTAALDAWFARRTAHGTALLATLEPHFLAAYHRHASAPDCAGARRRVAVLFSGALRTMLHPDSVRDLGEFLRGLRASSAKVHAFAYLNIDDPEGGGLRVADGRDRGCGARGFCSGRNASARLRAAFADWSVPFTLAEHRPGHRLLRPSASSRCLGPGRVPPPRHGRPSRFDSQRNQFRKVGAVTSLMTEAEARAGEAFDVVVRLRPDICLSPAAGYLAHALQARRE